MTNKLLKFIMISFVALLLAACGDEACKRECDENGNHCKTDCGSGLFECVEADDWGYPKIWVPADGDGDVSGGYPQQTAKPIDSEQILLGDDRSLVIAVGRDNQWTSWYGNTPAGSSVTVPDRECQFKVTNGSAPGDIADDLSPSTLWAEYANPNSIFYLHKNGNYYNFDAGVFQQGSLNSRGNEHSGLYSNTLTPCYYRHGMGLYVGLAPDVEGFSASSTNIINTYHIPDSKAPNMINNPNVIGDVNRSNREMDGYLVKGATSTELPGAQKGDRLFFKILDNYYNDNAGGYLVRIKEGTRNPKPGPLETITDALIDPVKTLMRRLYEGIIQNTDYVNAVRALLALYIVFYGFKFMIGMGSPEELRKDAVIRMIKIGVIIQLISPTSWDFFYNNLFAAFTEGIQQISALLMSPFDDYDPDYPWYSMDILLAKFFSAETNAKILSALLSNAMGILFVPILYLSMILFVKAVLRAVIVYIVAFIGIAVLIALAPIFFLFMLFEPTKKLMDEWFNQLLTFGLQQIILMAVLGMFAAIILDYMERTIGYRVCWNVWLDVDFPFAINETGPEWYPWHMFDLRFWMPAISNEMASIWMDVDGNGKKEAGEFARRYIDLPYFDPVYDRDIIARYMGEVDFLELADLGIFIFVVWLMMHFIKFVPTMAEELKGGGSKKDTTSVFGAAGGLYKAGIASFKQNLGHGVAFGKWGAKWGGKAAKSRAGRATGRGIKRGGIAAGHGIGRGAEFAADKTGLTAAGKAIGRGATKLGSGTTRLGDKAVSGAAKTAETGIRIAGFGGALDQAEKGFKRVDKISTKIFGKGKPTGGGADGAGRAGGLGSRGSGAGGGAGLAPPGGASAKLGKPGGKPDDKGGKPKTGSQPRSGLTPPETHDTGADARAAAERALAEAKDARQIQDVLDRMDAEEKVREANEAQLQENAETERLAEEARIAEEALAALNAHDVIPGEDELDAAEAKDREAKAAKAAHEKAILERRAAQLDADCKDLKAKLAGIEANGSISEAEKQQLMASEKSKLDEATRRLEAARTRLGGFQG